MMIYWLGNPLQCGAREMVAELHLAALIAEIGALLITGSLSSGPTCWRELDVMVLVSDHFSPHDLMGLLARIVLRAQVTFAWIST
jgi:hypothetical protein